MWLSRATVQSIFTTQSVVVIFKPFLISNMCYIRVQHRLQNNISERGKLPLKLTCPAGTSTCPAAFLNKGEIGLCPKHYLPSGASRGLVQLAPLPLFCRIHLQLATGPVVLLHAVHEHYRILKIFLGF